MCLNDFIWIFLRFAKIPDEPINRIPSVVSKSDSSSSGSSSESSTDTEDSEEERRNKQLKMLEKEVTHNLHREENKIVSITWLLLLKIFIIFK